MTDTERLDWMEIQDGCALVSDDAGHWVFSDCGFQAVPSGAPEDLTAMHFLEKELWRPSISGGRP
jgi:hypothetical protein